NHPTWPARPQPAATPGPRTDTASAESTVYAIRYHPIGDARSVHRGSFDVEAQHEPVPVTGNEDSTSASESSKAEGAVGAPQPKQQQSQGTWRIWAAIEALNPFAQSRQRPPPEVSAMTVRRLPAPSRRPERAEEGGRWDWNILGKLEDFASKRAERVREMRGSGGGEKLPVMRIPAPPTRRAPRESVDVPDGEPDTASRWPLPAPAPLPPDPNPNPAAPNADADASPPTAPPSPVQRVQEAREQAGARNVTIGEGPARSATTGGRSATTVDRSSTTRSGSSGTGGLPVLRIPAPPLRGRDE
ncbi:hypothetical protein V492_06937, partial [Pseudogymnoascus sp. VKM F-4246]